MIEFASAFAGVAGFDLPFEQLGMRCTAQIEVNPHRQKILARHFPDVPQFGDIQEVTGRDISSRGRPDLIVGGFPCEGLSSAAPHRLGLGDVRSHLFYDFARLVAETQRLIDDTRPRWVILENSPGLLVAGGGRDMEAVVRALEELGYGWAYRVVDSRHLGSAQGRQRVLVLGHRGGDPRPAGEVLALDEARGADRGVDHEGRPSTRGPKAAVLAEEHDGRVMFRKSRRPRSKTDFATYVPDDHSNTLTKFDNGWGNRQTHVVVDQGRPRVLTLTEWERLQGFPDGWTDGIPDGQRFAALGDAMNVHMARWLGERLAAVHASLPMIGAPA